MLSNGVEGLLYVRSKMIIAKMIIVVVFYLLGIAIISDNNAYACSLILREDVIHKPRFMLEVYPTADDNGSIEVGFMLLNKVYEDLADSLSSDRIPYYVEAELAPSADGYGEYTLLIYYYDHEQKYAERLGRGEGINHVRVRVALDTLNLIDLNPDCSTSPTNHRFPATIESLRGSTMDTIKRFDVSDIESISLRRISTDEAYIYYLAGVADVDKGLLSHPYIPFLLTITHDSGTVRQIIYAYAYTYTEDRGYGLSESVSEARVGLGLFLYHILNNLQYILAAIVGGCVVALLLARRGRLKKVA